MPTLEQALEWQRLTHVHVYRRRSGLCLADMNGIKAKVPKQCSAWGCQGLPVQFAVTVVRDGRRWWRRYWCEYHALEWFYKQKLSVCVTLSSMRPK